MDKITCGVISDLLPLYCDGVCTQDSRKVVEGHLESCSSCRKVLEQLQAGCSIFPEQEQQEEKIIKDMAAVWKKSVSKSFLKGVFAALCAVLLLTGGYIGLSRWPVVPIAPDKVQAQVEVSEAAVTVKLEVADGYKVLYSGQSATADGKLYIVKKRGMIPLKNGLGDPVQDTFQCPRYYTLEDGKKVYLKEIYYGTQDSHTLLWKE